MTTAQWRTTIETLPTQDWRSGAAGVLSEHDAYLRTGRTFAATQTIVLANPVHANRLSASGQTANYQGMTP